MCYIKVVPKNLKQEKGGELFPKNPKKGERS